MAYTKLQVNVPSGICCQFDLLFYYFIVKEGDSFSVNTLTHPVHASQGSKGSHFTYESLIKNLGSFSVNTLLFHI